MKHPVHPTFEGLKPTADDEGRAMETSKVGFKAF